MVFYFTLINNNLISSLQNNMHLHIEEGSKCVEKCN